MRDFEVMDKTKVVPKNTCGNCGEWDYTKHNNKWAEGLCRAMPPAANADGLAIWPTTECNEWCGHWLPCAQYGEQ